jgi:hypothetical protein
MIKYYLATDKVEVFHHGSYDDEIQELTTGQPHLFLFDKEEELHNALNEYGVDYSEPVEEVIEEEDPELLLLPLLENGDG